MAEENNEEEEKVPKDKSKLLGILFAVINLGVSGYGAYLVYASTLGHQKQVINEFTEKPKLDEMRKYMENNPIVYTLEPFVVNLKGSPRRTIRMELSLEMLSEDGYEEVISLGGKARDEVVNILNTKKFYELETIQGKLHLKDQIATSINRHLDRGVIKDVLFSDFVVQ